MNEVEAVKMKQAINALGEMTSPKSYDYYYIRKILLKAQSDCSIEEFEEFLDREMKNQYEESEEFDRTLSSIEFLEETIATLEKVKELLKMEGEQ